MLTVMILIFILYIDYQVEKICSLIFVDVSFIIAVVCFVTNCMVKINMCK